jgi:hypothetical protein
MALVCRHPKGPCLRFRQHPSSNNTMCSCSLASFLFFSARAPVIGSVACHSILRWHRQRTLGMPCYLPPPSALLYEQLTVASRRLQLLPCYEAERRNLLPLDARFFSAACPYLVDCFCRSLVTNTDSLNDLVKTNQPAAIRHDYPVAVRHAVRHLPHHSTLSCLVYRHLCLPLAANAAIIFLH